MRKLILSALCIILILSIGLFAFVLLFPKKYSDIILTNSEEYNLESYVVASVINIESGYDKKAVSNVGAIGLMQLMPTTALEVANKLNIEDFDLYEVTDNIKMGCFYLRYLMDLFDNNLINSLCAYNWGLSNVKSWIEKGNIDSSGTITNIPNKETSDYIKKFKVNSYVYSKIYKL